MNQLPALADGGNTPRDIPRHVAVIGLGLLGGSVAQAIRRQFPLVRLTACVRDPKNRHFALEHKIVDEAVDDWKAASEGADLILIATPVDQISRLAIQVHESYPNATLTDLGSTKARIVQEISGHSSARECFVGAHPIAGSEKTGVQHSRADLFENRPIVLTLSGHETLVHQRRAEAFWSATGGRLIHLSPSLHDEQLAATSHVPHLLAALVARMVSPDARSLIGSGWLDTTRIAAGDPAMWTAIVDANRTAIVQQLQLAQSDLNALIDLIQTQNNPSLQNWLQTAKERRSIRSET